jgi:hypothetical protein
MGKKKKKRERKKEERKKEERKEERKKERKKGKVFTENEACLTLIVMVSSPTSYFIETSNKPPPGIVEIFS